MFVKNANLDPQNSFKENFDKGIFRLNHIWREVNFWRSRNFMKEELLEGYHPTSLIYDKSEQNADICIQTKAKNEEICLFDRHTLSLKDGSYNDMTIMKKWLIDGLSFRFTRQPHDVLRTYVESKNLTKVGQTESVLDEILETSHDQCYMD